MSNTNGIACRNIGKFLRLKDGTSKCKRPANRLDTSLHLEHPGAAANSSAHDAESSFEHDDREQFESLKRPAQPMHSDATQTQGVRVRKIETSAEVSVTLKVT